MLGKWRIFKRNAVVSCCQTSSLAQVKRSEAIVSTLPTPNAAWLSSLVLNRADSKLYRLKQTAELEVGYFIYQSENNWSIGDENEHNSEWVSRMTGSGTEASPYLDTHSLRFQSNPRKY